MTEGDTRITRWRLPRLGLRMSGLISYVLCVSTLATMMACRFSLADSMVDRLGFGIVFALFLGTLAFVVFLAPLLLVFALIAQRWESVRPLLAWLGLAPAMIVSCSHLYNAVIWRLPSYERERYEQVVGVPLPADVRVIHARHGAGLQDRRHVWLFEGTPETFAKMVSDRGWFLNSGWTREQLFGAPFSQIARERFSQDTPWEPAEYYYWQSDPEEDEPRVVGGGPLIPDKEHRRWYVGWSG